MIDEEQVRSIIKKVLDEEHLTGFIKIFEKEHNLFRGSHDKIALPEDLEIPEKIITQIIRYVPDVSPSPYMFLDNFADNDKFWGWCLFKGNTPAGKSGWEIAGQYNLQVNNGKDGRWDGLNNEAPRLFTGILTYPCEIITKLDFFTANVGTYAELFLSKAGAGFGANNYLSIGRWNNGLLVTNNGDNLAFNGEIRMPVWLRIRIASPGYQALEAYFDYSVDGVNWINLYYQFPSALTGWLFQGGSLVSGIYVRNTSAAFNLVTGQF